MNSISINGLTIETNKPGMSMINGFVIFGDGSTYDSGTGTFVNKGEGYVRVNGKILEGQADNTPTPKREPVETKSHEFRATALSLKVRGDVTVSKHDRTGIRIEITGTSKFIESIKLDERGGTLFLEDKGSSQGGVISVGNNNIVMSGFGGRVSIGDVTGFSSVGESSSIKVFVPYRTSITVEASGSSDVTINGVNGPLNLSVKGSGDVKTSGASGTVQLNVSGSGSVSIGAGTIDSLIANASGSADIRFRGTAQTAILNASGSSDIDVDQVVAQPIKNRSGSADIRVRKVG
ncbi:MAG: DUF2807 domain-containing protein [Candidatus Microsaccharimonas sp.]